MRWPDRVQAIVDALGTLLPELLQGDEAQRRQLNQMMAEQCCYELGPNWGTKRADPTRPVSKDVICTEEPFIGWDTQISKAGWPRQIAQFPDSIDLAGQVFEPVAPVNHLSVSDAAPEPNRSDPTDAALAALSRRLDALHAATVDLGVAIQAGEVSLQAELRRLEVELRVTRVSLAALHERSAPTYRGRVLGWPVTLTPDRSD